MKERSRQAEIRLAQRAKAVVRRQIIGLAATMGPEALSARSRRVQEHLSTWLTSREVHAVGCYLAAPKAPVPDLRPFFATLRRKGITVAFPRVLFDTEQVLWVASDEDEGSEYPGMLVLQAPEGLPTISPGSLDLILLPVVAMDPTGVFVGDGSGMYDHVLRTVPKERAVAVGFSFQMIPDAPRSEGDQSVAWIATDDRVAEARTREVQDPMQILTRDLETPQAAKEVHRANFVDRGGPRPRGGTRRRLDLGFERKPPTNRATRETAR